MEHFIATVRKYPCLWNTTAIEYRDLELKDAAWAEVMKETDLSSVKEVKLKWKKLRDSYRDALKRQTDMLAKDPANPPKKNYPWKYMGPMQFLQPYMGNRKKPAEAPAQAALEPHQPNGHVSVGPHNGAEGHSSEEFDSEADADGEEETSPTKRKSGERLTAIDRKLEYLCRVHAKRQCVEGAGAGPGAAKAPAVEHSPPPPAAPSQPAPSDPLDIFFNSMCQATKRFPFPAQIKIKKTLFGAVIEAEEALVAEQQSYASLWARGGGSSSSSDVDPPEDEERKPS
ncbi:hypothetical protein K1T71_010014 [Dendrolimus kikuchii]|uniref:Uncharacterized protein n=1 Tax=Dendrolimus kikuchii TaxID=765133 RepID=A0ACC1CTN1_9NEOP|nr:hypothetical protein K1T71_010014 [Dendrolimus kikuchii]